MAPFKFTAISFILGSMEMSEVASKISLWFAIPAFATTTSTLPNIDSAAAKSES